jgi:hypothetical protein
MIGNALGGVRREALPQRGSEVVGGQGVCIAQQEPYGPQPARANASVSKSVPGMMNTSVPLSVLQALMYSRGSSLSPRNAIGRRLPNGTCRPQIRTDLTVCGTASIPSVAATFSG